MIGIFLSHQWKDFWRSRNRGGSIAAQILLGLFVLYFLALAVAAGVGMPFLLPKIFPNQEIMKSFNGLILYYFAIDFLMRLQLQELPTLSIIPYLHLRIPKSKIINFLNIKALFSGFNLMPLFIFLPFCFMKIVGLHGFFTALMYIVAIFSITLFNNYLILYVKRKSINNVMYTIAGLVIIATFAALEYYKVISIMAASNFVFKFVSLYPYLAIIFAVISYAIFKINANYLAINLYVEELSKKQEKKASTDYAFLNRFGKVGELAALELKLILRHKRSRTTVFMGFLFLFYGFIFYKEKALDRDAFSMMIFGAIFLTGFSILGYGQFMFAWQSSHFDGLLTNKINFRDFIKAKFLLFNIACTATSILASIYFFLSPKLILLHIAAYLYNIGFSTVLVLFMATFNYKRIDITKSATFNYQGVGASQWLLTIPFMLVPYLFYLPFGYWDKPYWGLIAIAIFGLAMLLTRAFWIDFIVNRFEKQRYKIAEGFRE